MFIVHCYIDTRTIKRAQIIYALTYVHTVSLFELIPYIRKIDRAKDDMILEQNKASDHVYTDYMQPVTILKQLYC